MTNIKKKMFIEEFRVRTHEKAQAVSNTMLEIAPYRSTLT